MSVVGHRAWGIAHRVGHHSMESQRRIKGVAGFGLRVAGYALRVTRCGLRVAGYGVRVTGYEFRLAGCGKWHRAGHRVRRRSMEAVFKFIFPDFPIPTGA
jgi:hypothetical protein